MAKSGLWLRGAKGKLAGTVIAKGANGQTVIRELVTPKNPKTEAQATQRMKMAACCNFYRGLSQILDHSFEGVKYGNSSRMYFMKQALSSNLTVAAVERGSKGFTPLPLKVSVGSLTAPSLFIDNGVEFALALTKTPTQAQVTAMENRETAIPVIAELLDVEMGSQLTFISVNTSPVQKISVRRLILQQNVQDDFDTIVPSISTQNSMLTWYASDELSAAAVILSKEVDGKWLRSTSTMVLSQNKEEEVYNGVAVEAVKTSYMQKQSASLNDEYLNEGGIDNGSIVYVAMDGGTFHAVGHDFTTSKTTAEITLKLTNASQFSIDKLSIENGQFNKDAVVIKGNDVTVGISGITTSPCKLKYNGVTILSVTKSA